MDYRLELIILPVSDPDRARSFYVDQLGWNADHDVTVSDEIRFVQVTPPGSACSIAFGKGLTDAPPGSIKLMQVVVESADEAHADLSRRGVEISPIDDQPWGRFINFTDPDGNAWAVQEIVIPGEG